MSPQASSDSRGGPTGGGKLLIEVNRRVRRVDLPARAIRTLVGRVCQAEQVRAGQVSVAVVDQATMQDLNRRYRDQDRTTDVLSFDLRDNNSVRLEGEVVVSADEALRQARRRGTDPADELALYVIHGLLHLLGYNDHRPPARRRMAARQRSLWRDFQRSGPDR